MDESPINMSNEPIDMPKITFQYGVFMILLGVIFYVVTDFVSKTAMLPSLLGCIFLLGNKIAENEKWKMHVMHLLVLLALIGVIMGLYDNTGLNKIKLDGEVELKNIERMVMSIASAVYMYFCIQSFKQARLSSKED